MTMLRGAEDPRGVPIPIRTRSNAPGGRTHNVPEPLSSFIGRDGEVAGVAGLVAQGRLVTIAGTGGMGKTRLAYEVARRRVTSSGTFDGGATLTPMSHLESTWIVELAPVDSGELVPYAVFSELLGPAPETVRVCHDLVDFLRDRRTLLVLDNCEHVLAGCVDLVSQLLGSCPRLRILATSREPLRITGERVWWLQPLIVPESDDRDAASLAATEAVDLFVQRAQDAAPGFRLEGDAVIAVGEICRRLDGLPLAIELAAARAALLSPAEILAHLDDRFHLLTGGSAAADARHQTLRAALEWSHDLLSAPEAMLLRRLSVFAGSWSLTAAEQVCSGDDVAHHQVLDLLAALLAKSLIVADQAEGATRYRLLETIREYAKGKLDAPGEADRLRARHATWCVGRVESAERGRQGTVHEAWLQRLDEDADNFRAALAWARDHHDAKSGLRLANGLTWFWQTRGYLREGLDWLEWALSVSADAPSAARAQAMRGAGRLLHTLGEHDRGLELIDRSVALFREVGEAHEAGGCVCKDLLQVCRNPLHAIPVMEQNVARIRTMGDPNRLAHALSNLGLARFFRGDAPGARSCFAEVVGLQSAGIDGDAAEQALMGLARVALLAGRYDDVEPPLAQVLDHARRVNDPDGQSAALSLLGELARARGDSAQARALLGEALDFAQDAGAALSIGRCELFLGLVELGDGELDAAEALFTRATRRGQAGATLAYHQVRCMLGLADVAAASGDAASAASLYAESLDAAQVNGDDQAAARALAGRAELALESCDFEASVRFRHRALELEEQIGDLAGIARSLEALATVFLRSDRGEKAARLFGAAAALREQFGFGHPPRLVGRYRAELDRGRQVVGAPAWEQAWEVGRSLPLAEAIVYARKGRGSRTRPSTGWDSLTPAERDVVDLVLKGLSNPEVGERLFISRRTVGHHLSHVYSKLGIQSRRELRATWSVHQGNLAPR